MLAVHLGHRADFFSSSGLLWSKVHTQLLSIFGANNSLLWAKTIRLMAILVLSVLRASIRRRRPSPGSNGTGWNAAPRWRRRPIWLVVTGCPSPDLQLRGISTKPRNRGTLIRESWATQKRTIRLRLVAVR